VLVRNDTHERNLRATELHADTVLEDKAENTLIELGALRGARYGADWLALSGAL